MFNSFPSGAKVVPKKVPVCAIAGVPPNHRIEKMRELTVSLCEYFGGEKPCMKITFKGIGGAYNSDDFEYPK